MQKLPIGIQDFVGLRQDGYLYVDKTELIYRLVTSGKVYFLSRPRRFGKSLLLSTLDALFSGRRELFEGLWITQPHEGIEPWPFESGPVVRLDMNAAYYRQGLKYLRELLATQLEGAAARYGLAGTSDASEPSRFATLLAELHRTTGKRVTVLIDEYDKPLLETLDDPALHGEMRSALKAFYGVLKSADEHLRFTFITGVTKFSQVSVFSDLNHLNDISLDYPYATLCGITQVELERDFEPEIAAYGQLQFAELDGQAQRARAIDALREWYDGYRFHPKASHVYNPFGTLCALQKSEPRNYWFQTGTPSFLLRLMRQYPLPLEGLESVRMPVASFSEIDPERLGPIAVLFQAGYLTIAGYSASTEEYELRYPNREVHQSLLRALAEGYAPLGYEWQTQNVLGLLVREVRKGDVDAFMTHLRAFFANIPYDLHIPRERYHQTVFYLVFRLIGFNVQAEVKHATGRTDAIIETSDRVYLFEFKLDRSSAEDALRQIDDKGYATPYLGSGKQVVKVGVAFDSELKNIDRWVVG